MQTLSAEQLLPRRSAGHCACSNSSRVKPVQMVARAGSGCVSALLLETDDCKLSGTAATAKPAPAALQVSATAAAVLPMQQCDMQQQHQPPDGSYSTQLLVIDSSRLPPVNAPDNAAVQQILSAAEAPNLSPQSCPHLYYTLTYQQSPTHSSSMDCTNSSLQQQQQLAALRHAADLINQDHAVAIPTETVYGLAANALSASAVAHIFRAKGRPSDNPLIVHISDLGMLYKLYPDHLAAGTNPIPQQYHRLIAAFWPGPLTILLPASPLIPAAVTAGQSTVAVRMPAHPLARALIAAAGVPLAAPSANTSGKPSPTTAQHVLDDLTGQIVAVIDGGVCGLGVESTVLDGMRVPPVILRPGGVTAEQLEKAPEMAGLQVYSRDFTDKALEANPTTPGMKYRHYSPAAPVLLLDPSSAFQQLQVMCGNMHEEEHKQAAMQRLQQAMVVETQGLLQQLQQQKQPVRVVLLSTCSCSALTPAAEVAPGWTGDSLQQLQAAQWSGMHLPRAACDAHGGEVQRSAAVTGSGFQLLEYVLGNLQRPEAVAKELFGALRAADDVGCNVVVVQGVLPVGTGMAVMNRLQKAASQRRLVNL